MPIVADLLIFSAIERAFNRPDIDPLLKVDLSYFSKGETAHFQFYFEE